MLSRKGLEPVNQRTDLSEEPAEQGLGWFQLCDGGGER